MSFSHPKFVTLIALLCSLVLSAVAQAHNKVVVIPMPDDALVPFARIPTSEPNSADYTSTNGVTLDKTTGLEWQQEDSNTDYLFANANQYCSNLVLDAKSDWRLPSIKELLSIVNLNESDPTVNQTVFPNTESAAYWSVTDFRLGAGQRWAINFFRGTKSTPTESSTMRARCVRSSGQTALANVFKDHGNGSVSDLASGLTWQQQDDGVLRNRVDAFRYCRNLVLAGRTDWRVPPLKELASIVDYSGFSPAIDLRIFPATRASSYWSQNTADGNSNRVWLIFFGSGASANVTSGVSGYVRCVSVQGSTAEGEPL